MHLVALNSNSRSALYTCVWLPAQYLQWIFRQNVLKEKNQARKLKCTPQEHGEKDKQKSS